MASDPFTLRDLYDVALATLGNAEQARVATAIAWLERGWKGAVGDTDQGLGSFGVYQFFSGGQLPAYAAYVGLPLADAGYHAIAHPSIAAQWALRGYLGDKIREGYRQGLRGPELAVYAQRYGQVSRSPERAGTAWRELFGPGGVGLDGLASLGGTVIDQIGGIVGGVVAGFAADQLAPTLFLLGGLALIGIGLFRIANDSGVLGTARTVAAIAPQTRAAAAL